MTKPFDQHQRAISRWQPSAHLFGRTLWRALVRGAVARDTEERRGRAPVTAILPAQCFGPVSFGGHFVIRYKPHSNQQRGYA